VILQLAAHLKQIKPLGGLANEILDDLIHCSRKMRMEAIKGGHYKTTSLPATPIKVILVFILCLELKKDGKMGLIFERISQPYLIISI
jgi:hypothetical protein